MGSWCLDIISIVSFAFGVLFSLMIPFKKEATKYSRTLEPFITLSKKSRLSLEWCRLQRIANLGHLYYWFWKKILKLVWKGWDTSWIQKSSAEVMIRVHSLSLDIPHERFFFLDSLKRGSFDQNCSPEGRKHDTLNFFSTFIFLQSTMPDILCMVQVALEGAISKQSALASLAKGTLPSVYTLPKRILAFQTVKSILSLARVWQIPGISW